MNNTLLNGYFKRVCLTEVMFQWNIPTILPNYNDRLSLFIKDISGGTTLTTLTFDLDSGFYTPTTMASMIQGKITPLLPVGASATFAWNATYGAFTFSTSTPGYIVGITAQGLLAGNVISRVIRTQNTLGLANTAEPITGGSPLVFGNPPTMLATRWVDICSSYLTKYQRAKDATTYLVKPTSDALTRLYAVAPSTRYNITANDSPGSSPFIIVQDMNNPKFFLWSSAEAIANSDFQVRDEYGDILPTFQGYCSEYSLTLMLSES